MDNKIITVDGPSGVGKGTITKKLAKKFDYNILDSGSIYRLAAYKAVKNGVNLENENDVVNCIKGININFSISNNKIKSHLDGDDVTDKIRTESNGIAASKIASYQEVRDELLSCQLEFSTEKGLVADGRDMGTAVFPNAQHKIFLDGSLQIRAQRRCDQLTSDGINVSYNKILDSLKKRDDLDKSRKASPLKQADDAFVLDTSFLNEDEVFKAIMLWMGVK